MDSKKLLIQAFEKLNNNIKIKYCFSLNHINYTNKSICFNSSNIFLEKEEFELFTKIWLIAIKNIEINFIIMYETNKNSNINYILI